MTIYDLRNNESIVGLSLNSLTDRGELELLVSQVDINLKVKQVARGIGKTLLIVKSNDRRIKLKRGDYIVIGSYKR